MPLRVADHKREARQLELAGESAEALELYRRIIAKLEQTPSELREEAGLFNKVGNLYYRMGHEESAADSWERGAQLYAERGHHENAMALFRKMVRKVPERRSAYRALAKLLIERGKETDARHYLLEFARRTLRDGRAEEAFEALHEYAELCPEDTEIRLLLAQGLKRGPDLTKAVDQRVSTGLRFIDLDTPTERPSRLVPDADDEDDDLEDEGEDPSSWNGGRTSGSRSGT